MLSLMIIEWPLVTFAGAFLASLGVFDIWIVFFLGWIGDILGDFLFYGIGRYGLNIFRKKTIVNTEQEKNLIYKLDQLIHTNLALAILIIKFTPYAPPIGLTYIGKIRVNLKKYVTYSILLCIPIPLVSSLIGFHLGSWNTLFAKYSGVEFLLYLSLSLWIIAISITAVLLFKNKSSKMLGREDATSKKIEKNTKAGTKSDEVA